MNDKKGGVLMNADVRQSIERQTDKKTQIYNLSFFLSVLSFSLSIKYTFY